MTAPAKWGAKRAPRRIRVVAKPAVGDLPSPTERQGQRTVLQWLALVLPPGSRVAHIANEAAVNPDWPAYAKARYFEERKKDGVLEGMPDLLLCLPGRRVLFVEMKRLKGGRLTSEQQDRLVELAALGFPVTVARTIDEVRQLLIADGVPLREAIVPEVRAA